MCIYAQFYKVVNKNHMWISEIFSNESDKKIIWNLPKKSFLKKKFNVFLKEKFSLGL